MTRDEVQSMVMRHAVEAIPELKNVKIDPSKPYTELGLDSMALVQILTAATQEMKIKLSGDQLADITNLNELVDLLLKTKKASA